ncbi:MAG: glucose 1-dehydrogenase [Sphingomonadaceae bacterium]|nr:glucose 1-dehydrogenase [Sphingomonadaceae bacterium]
MDFSLNGKVALVTGGARGLGLAFCTALAEAGAQVVMADVLEAEGRAATDALTAQGHAVTFQGLDVSSESDWADAVDAIKARYGQLDVLLNNAGVGGAGTFLSTTLEDWNRTIAINLTGVFLGCRTCVPLMAESGGGSVINISSIFGQVSDWLVCAYSASKGGVRSLTKSVALMCGEMQNNVRVNSVHPGFVHTPMVEQGVAETPKEIGDPYMARTVGQVPLGRIGNPDDLAGAIVFLASDASRYMTGSEVTVDGGFTAR